MSDRESGTLTRRRLLIGLGVLGGGVGGVLGWRTLRQSQPVTVGGSLPLSGPLRPIGVPLHRGLQLWAADVNDSGGLAGRGLTLDIRDDKGNPETARTTYRSLVETADVLVAPYGSRLTAAVIDIIEEAGIPCIAHTAGRRDLFAAERTWTVQLLNPIDTFLHSALDAAIHAGARTVAFVYREDGFTPTTMAGAIERARQGDWEVLNVAVYGTAAEMEDGLHAVMQPPPDFLVGGGFQSGAAGGGFLPDAIALSRAYEDLERTAGLVCWSIGAAFRQYADRLGDGANLVTGVTGWKPYVGYPGTDGFIDRYRDRWGGVPDSHAAQGYATGEVLIAAHEQAGSFEPTTLRDALFDHQTETVFGQYAVNQTGLQVGKTNAVMQWQDDRPVVVAPDRWRTGELVY